MRIIGHADLDAFFAAVEERNNPRLKGLPIVVGANPQGGAGRGVVSTANYLARAYGIHSAQPISQAWRNSETARQQGKPPAVFLSGSFGTYGTTSKRVMDILAKHVPRIQKRSIDEAYLDLNFTGSYQKATALACQIKQEIVSKEKITISIGIGPNKLIAKIASDHDKPDGLTVIPAAQVESFLAPLPIRVIPGVGPKTAEQLRHQGITHVGDAKQFSKPDLEQLLGKWGTSLYHKVRGLDNSPLTEHRGSTELTVEVRAKSISEQRTFYHDTLAPTPIIERMLDLCDDVTRRLFDEGFHTARTVTIRVRFADFKTCTRAHTLPQPVKTSQQLKIEALRLLLPFFDARENPQAKRLRLIGVGLSKLE